MKMSNVDIGGRAFFREELKLKRARSMEGLREMGEAQTYTELFRLAQRIWDWPAGSQERRIYCAAYQLRLKELKEDKYHWNPDKQDFKIKAERNSTVEAHGNSAWAEAWN